MEDDQTKDAIDLAPADGQEVGIEAQCCYKIIPRILPSRNAPETRRLLRWRCITSLLPTRWVFILSSNLIHFQVDAEIHVAREGDQRDQNSEEDETEVLQCP